MIEDKIKQEYEWQHREIGQPTLDELFSKINEALGIELWIWQKTYVSAVSIPANNDTEISARNFANRSYEQEKQELLKRRAMILKIKASL